MTGRGGGFAARCVIAWAAFLVALALASAVGAPSAYAHNGIGAAFKGRIGQYVVWAYDGDPLSRTRLEYRLIIVDATQQPVYGEHVAVTATWPGAPSAVATVTTFGNVFFYDLPNPYPRDWLMHLTVTGALGHGHAAYKMHGAAPQPQPEIVVTTSGTSPWPAIVGVACGGLALAMAAVWLRRRRTAASRSQTASAQPVSESAHQ